MSGDCLRIIYIFNPS